MSLRMRKNRSPKPPQECPLLTCTSVIGGAWTPSIIWYLSGGPRRFTELKNDIPPIDRPFVNIFGTTTERSLIEAISNKDVLDGHLNRMLIVHVSIQLK